MLTPGHTVSLTIDQPAAGGRMIGRLDGQVVLVAGAIPGERVAARIERVGKGVAYAETTAVESASADRRPTESDPACGGCMYAHITYARQLEIKSLVIGDAFRRIGRIPLAAPVPVAASPEQGYRMRARLHVRGGRVGFFREGTHTICDARQTRQLLPATLDTLERISAAIRSLGGDAIREIELAENADASHRVVHLDTIAPIAPRVIDLLGGTDGLTGLSSSSGARGDARVTDVIAIDGGPGVSLRRHVLAFSQSNRFLLQDLAAHVARQVDAGGPAIDLYAGAGLFALTAAAAHGIPVTAVEGDRLGAADLAANCEAAGGIVRPVHQAVEAFLDGRRRGAAAAERPQTIILDPPRTGMSRQALDGVLALQARRLVYVSCDVATLARDARRLIDASYAIVRADGFDLFPNTPHVETVTVFTRR